MKNVERIEKSISSINEFFNLIRKSLTECMDTQIFISNELFKRLLYEYKNNIIWEEVVLDSLQYSDNVEIAFIFAVKGKTVQMHFVQNSLDYVQLTLYASKGIIYHHYLREMKIILIINTD